MSDIPKLVEQTTMKAGLLTVWSDGYQEVIPYETDENGEQYSELFPNHPETWKATTKHLREAFERRRQP